MYYPQQKFRPQRWASNFKKKKKSTAGVSNFQQKSTIWMFVLYSLITHCRNQTWPTGQQIPWFRLRPGSLSCIQKYKWMRKRNISKCSWALRLTHKLLVLSNKSKGLNSQKIWPTQLFYPNLLDYKFHEYRDVFLTRPRLHRAQASKRVKWTHKRTHTCSPAALSLEKSSVQVSVMAEGQELFSEISSHLIGLT